MRGTPGGASGNTVTSLTPAQPVPVEGIQSSSPAPSGEADRAGSASGSRPPRNTSRSAATARGNDSAVTAAASNQGGVAALP